MSDTPQKVIIHAPRRHSDDTDDHVWEDLEGYLFQGFLTSQATWLDWSFVFKTLNQHEIRTLGFFRPLGTSPLKQKTIFRNTFIAHSVLMLNGQNMLDDRVRHIRKLIGVIDKLPASILEKIFEELNSLNSRATRLHPLAEVYAYESRGRFRWLQVKSGPINSPNFTGIPGTQELGMNLCQQTYVAVSQIIDSRDGYERDWANAKFIGGCFAGKGIRQIEEQDKARKQREDEDRMQHRESVLKAYLNRTGTVVEKPPELITLPDGRTAEVVSRQRANTVEELADQLSRALSNEKDAHDLVIEAEIKRAQERAAEIEKQKRVIAAQNANIPSMQLGSRVLTSKEVEERARRMKALANQDTEELFPASE